MKTINFIEKPNELSLKQMGEVFGGSLTCSELTGSCDGFTDDCTVFTGSCTNYSGTCFKFESPANLVAVGRK